MRRERILAVWIAIIVLVYGLFRTGVLLLGVAWNDQSIAAYQNVEANKAENRQLYWWIAGVLTVTIVVASTSLYLGFRGPRQTDDQVDDQPDDQTDDQFDVDD